MATLYHRKWTLQVPHAASETRRFPPLLSPFHGPSPFLPLSLPILSAPFAFGVVQPTICTLSIPISANYSIRLAYVPLNDHLAK